MFVWDGTDRKEGDQDAASQDAERRWAIMGHPLIPRRMQDYVAAMALTVTGAKASLLVSPAPLFMGGFTPDDYDRDFLCSFAELNGRDIIHINFRTVAPYTPTGLITTIFVDRGKAHAHSRGGLLASRDDHRARLIGFSDTNDDNVHFRVRPGVKMTRHPGLSRPFTSANIRRAEAMVNAQIETGAIGDTSDEPLAFAFYYLRHAEEG